ncbi:MAG: hypothetical protein K0R39_1236 [Symbiobacteriaceae bacterium]|jgi:hypothetical protein|nr:hypothetical protein [Symbiobacteriaceae bacterium]
MVIAVVGIALLVVAFAVPNYLAVRYAVFGGAPGAVAAGGAVTAAAAGGVSGIKRDRLAFARRGYLWKALSPLLFAMSVILGLGLGGALGLSLVALATLNLVWGFIGWDGFVAGR